MSDPGGRAFYPIASLSAFLRTLRTHWRFVGAVAFGTAALTAAVVLLLPRRYTSEASFQAEATQAPSLSGALAGLASQLGALQLLQPTNPQFFADLISSDRVISRVAGARYPVGSDTLTLAAIYGYDKKPPVVREEATNRRLRKAIQVRINGRTGVISFGVSASSPRLARALAETTLVELNDANIALRRSRASAEAAFATTRADEARMELSRAEDALTAFYNRNRQIENSASLRTVEGRLQRAVDVAQSIYTQLRLQQEQAAIQALRNTPAITTIDVPTLPTKAISPRRKLSVTVGFLAGLSLAIGWLVIAGERRKRSPVLQAAAITLLLLFPALAGGCLDDRTAGPSVPGACDPRRTIPAELAAQCLAHQGIITDSAMTGALALIDSVRTQIDTLRALGTTPGYGAASELTRSLVHVAQFYSRGLFPDSVRFNRMLDHVRVTVQYVNGTIPKIAGRLWPSVTPFLSWTYYPNLGVYFQPVNTVQSVAFIKPRANVPTDSLLAMGEALYRYAVHRRHNGTTFPMWEYEFTWNSGGIVTEPPWISAQAQGYALILFAENFKRTGDVQWRDRGYEVLRSFQTLWDDGGVLLQDTTHGYWWEEYHPVAMIWNGSAQAALAVGQFWEATGDSAVKRLFDRGMEAMKYYTPFYDTGSWTLYSLVQGFNSVGYHSGCIDIADQLYVQSGDVFFKETADRWRTYVPPPGVF